MRRRHFQKDSRFVESHSVTTWIARIKAGESAAAQQLWNRYLTRLVQVAKTHLAGGPNQIADADDVVVTAYERFLRFTQQGRFPQLDDRSDLWQVLVTLTERAAIDQRRRLSAQKRGERITQSLSAGPRAGEDSHSYWQLQSLEPTPEFAVAATEQFKRLLNLLDDDLLRRVAVAKLDGFTNKEIAAQEALSVRTVERKLNIIRQTWAHEQHS
jgi:RNA polymerase sigma factor (sigma-70 family)